jgi:hypothetical protein
VATNPLFVPAGIGYLLKAAVLGGCTHLVFWRGESGWLYVPAAFIAKLAR